MLEALEDVLTAWDKVVALPANPMAAPELLSVLERVERLRRLLPAVEHTVLTQLQAQTTPVDVGAKSWRTVLTHRLGISGADASRRLTEAAELAPRHSLTGQALPPALPTTAAAQARGEIGIDHVSVIRSFMDHLPASVDAATREHAEAQLGGLAGGLTPEGLRKLAHQLMAMINQDGDLDDEREQARKRGVSIGPQQIDGMSKITGWVDPELRAALDAIFAKLAAPGYCNPGDENPCVDGTPTEDQISGDLRSTGQRTHDALKTVCMAMLSSGQLGQHNGLPVTIVVTTTLEELTSAAGLAHTGGGSYVPIPTVIRMAAHAHPYLTVFESPKEIKLYHGRARRTASPGQRLALYALDKGCTKPDCTAPAYQSQVHHAARDFAHGGNTDINELTLACGCDNRMVNDGPAGWTTRKHRRDNKTEWIPPPHLDRGQTRVNYYHHPEELLCSDE
ncbi:HNH endonuclease signature motif containing protein [Mycobacterium sp. CVI_P3]|uniref:HNH endonuclease signature motif containing protein n=1 Tax=Mycobacterium pinniadriaticum TaxID=2994102 RepID=A0ABT3SCD5_9MYCO|nr:HNH endonuclease signature motif containing protein [Mycobacterium pinniadriaticum]MCX2930358.1 HNH endonuclease signature motif containing protein [Mycobacterium pinniadriaticum]MCX2936580.1 HNH endonuclease signature motif containing protein [Mycobacterium pinniadriaticum]